MGSKLTSGFLAIVFSLLIFNNSYAQIDSAELKKWQGLKYSMFIHFGIYSELGGVWKEKNIEYGLSEQIQAHAGIYSDTYAEVADTFNPDKWNADSVALLAKESGMKSIVITSKHHDGFCMFKTATTDFNIVDATPYKRDFLKDLSEACKKQGLKFGIYFSLIDWHYPQASPISSHNSDMITPEHHEYNKKQITELLSNYGPVSELWFDMGSMSSEQSVEMRQLVHRLQPNCMIGSRIGNDMGDFTVMSDNQEPDYIIGVPWQSPASFFDETWGYRSWQKRTDPESKLKEKLTSLIRVVSRGGNFLLNIGPRGDGSVVEYEKDILLKMGDWLRKNGEAIYNTTSDPFHISFDWGSITAKQNKLYLHILSNPKNNHILLPGLSGDVLGVSVLGENAYCKVAKNNEGIGIDLPASFNVNKEFKVVVLEFSSGFSAPPANLIPVTNNAGVTLSTANAFKYFSNSGIDYNTRFTSTIKEVWTLNPQKNFTLIPELVYTEEEKGKEIDLNIGDNQQVIKLENDEEIKIKSQPITTGTMYLQGPLPSGIENVPTGMKDIDVNKPWTLKNAKVWQPHPEWKNGTTYTLPAGQTTAYFLLQEIESPAEQQLLVKITSGDALSVFLNGDRKFIQINAFKKPSVEHYVLLDLKKGKNQLVVKLFNNFQKQLPFNIDYNISQVLYRKQLPEIKINKNKYCPVSWKLHNPYTPHTDLDLPNTILRFKAK